MKFRVTNAGIILGYRGLHIAVTGEGKGGTVGKHTDIFAFGCVLYEMLTACAAFDGDDGGEILARVIEREPDTGTVCRSGNTCSDLSAVVALSQKWRGYFPFRLANLSKAPGEGRST